MIDSELIKKDFPILNGDKKLIYFDNAATTQKPDCVIGALSDFYTKTNANVHRGIYDISEQATDLYAKSREVVAGFIGAKFEEIVFTRNATEAINLVSNAWARNSINDGDNIVLSILEHHSNIVPWHILAKEKNVEIRFVDIDEKGYLNIDEYENLIDSRTKLVSINHISNAIGIMNPIKKIIDIAHSKGVKVLVDACQSVAHMPINVVELDVDFLVFSGHKMLGPMGIGVLYAKKDILNSMGPFLGGGDMISDVFVENSEWNKLPYKFEAGTPNAAGAIALGEAAKYIQKIGFDFIKSNDEELCEYALEKVNAANFLEIIGPNECISRASIISFEVQGVHPHDTAAFLNSRGVCVRAGKHCAHPLFRKFGKEAAVRASFYIYNSKEEIDVMMEALNDVYKLFN